jgi:excisionase family DNA binding protein
MSSDGPGRASRILEGTVKVWEILPFLESDHYMTKLSAAAFIDHKNDRKIEEGIRSGQLRAYRIGKKILIRKSELIAWVESHEVTRENRKANRTDLQKLVDGAIDQARKRTA